MFCSYDSLTGGLSPEFASAEHTFGHFHALGSQARQESGQDAAAFEIAFGPPFSVDARLDVSEQVVQADHVAFHADNF